MKAKISCAPFSSKARHLGKLFLALALLLCLAAPAAAAPPLPGRSPILDADEPFLPEGEVFSAVRGDDPIRLSHVLMESPNLVNARDPGTLATPLHFACNQPAWAKRRDQIVSTLLSYGADPNARDFLGRSPLHLAAAQGNDEAVKLLLRWGANPAALDDLRQTPAQTAAAAGHPATARLITAAPKAP